MLDFYYLNEANQPVGPMDLPAIRKLAAAGIVAPEVLVCEAGRDDWLPLSQKEVPTATAQTPKPPRTPPTQPPPQATPTSQFTWGGMATAYPDWFPLASMIAGIASLFALCLPSLSLIIAAPALTLGILGYKQTNKKTAPFAMAGIATAAFAILCSFGIFLFGIGGAVSSDAASIETALQKGAKVGRAAPKKYPGDNVKQARYIAVELQKIDTRSCPADFRVAYQRNIDAWEVAAPYFAADTPVTSFLEGFFGGLSNDYSGVGRSGYQARLAVQNINTTYRDLRVIAVAYGARIPSY